MKKFILIAVVMSCAFASELYTLPVPGHTTLTAAYFTPRPYGLHQALDIMAERYSPVVAAVGGEVIVVDYDKTLGNHIKIRLSNGNIQLYAHLQRVYKVWPGDTVVSGQKIGEVGNTGASRGCHLHFAEFNSRGQSVQTTFLFGIIWKKCGDIYAYQGSQ